MEKAGEILKIGTNRTGFFLEGVVRRDRVSKWPGNCFLNQAGLELTRLLPVFASPRAELKGVSQSLATEFLNN